MRLATAGKDAAARVVPEAKAAKLLVKRADACIDGVSPLEDKHANEPTIMQGAHAVMDVQNFPGTPLDVLVACVMLCAVAAASRFAAIVVGKLARTATRAA